MRNYLQPLLPRSQFAFARYLFLLTKKSFFVGAGPRKLPNPIPLVDESFVSNESLISPSGSKPGRI